MKIYPRIVLILCLFFTGCSASDVSSPNRQRQSVIDEDLMLKLVNNARKKGCKCGDTFMPPVAAVKWNNNLEKVAQIHSNDMSRRNYFSHTSPEGKVLRDRMKQVKYAWAWIAENIAHGQMDTKEVVSGWLNSPSHCINIMNPNYREMGVALKGNYWTQVFGSQK